MAPFIANMTYGMDNYKWILYGDDDTVFFIDNVLDLVKDLDHNMPYFISDAIWWPNWNPGESLVVGLALSKAQACCTGKTLKVEAHVLNALTDQLVCLDLDVSSPFLRQ